jgi:hypothetical protein
MKLACRAADLCDEPQTSGSNAVPRSANSGLVRSAAMLYWIGSFVPMQKKSNSRASASAMSAAAGTSIMMPTWVDLRRTTH